jgi:hypothetical protein
MIGRGNGSTRRKPAPAPLCPPQTPHAAKTRTARQRILIILKNVCAVIFQYGFKNRDYIHTDTSSE